MKQELTPNIGILENKRKQRPVFPTRAVITGGMPYGNKTLHFAHIGGYFVHADVLARFLRDRIGAQNVVFVSGMDCYGSPLYEEYRKRVESGEFSGGIEDMAALNHAKQKATLDDYQISLNLFGGSSLPPAVKCHHEISAQIIKTLYDNGHLIKLSAPQFFDTERGVFLNGRQVVGRCPVAGCQSEKGYADECGLGHQYMPKDLIDPRSTLSDKKPELRDVANWYLKMDSFRDLLKEWVSEFETRPDTRPFVPRAVREFLEPPVIYLKREYIDTLRGISGLPRYEIDDDGKSTSVRVVFDVLSDREAVCAALTEISVNYRTGKTLVPFRLTGNISWGVPAPELEGLSDLTVWVWPESLWAPISFTRTFLETQGFPADEWKKWWTDKDARVWQFLGQDNIYFYGPAQAALFMGLQGTSPKSSPDEGCLPMTDLIVSNHILFLNKKASSSGKVKPPMAADLLEYYTPEQLRAHFLGLGLGIRSVSFQPKPLNPDAAQTDADPVLKEGSLLTNVLNRVARSCFYTAQKFTSGMLPAKAPSQAAVDEAALAALDYETLMYRCEFHQVMNLLDSYIRGINKMWAREMREADAADDTERRIAVLSDALHMLRVAAVLVHPIAPMSAELLADYLVPGCLETVKLSAVTAQVTTAQVTEQVSAQAEACGFGHTPAFFDWVNIFKPMAELVGDPENHTFRFLEPRFDFFKKHPSQL